MRILRLVMHVCLSVCLSVVFALSSLLSSFGLAVSFPPSLLPKKQTYSHGADSTGALSRRERQEGRASGLSVPRVPAYGRSPPPPFSCRRRVAGPCLSPYVFPTSPIHPAFFPGSWLCIVLRGVQLLPLQPPRPDSHTNPLRRFALLPFRPSILPSIHIPSPPFAFPLGSNTDPRGGRADWPAGR